MNAKKARELTDLAIKDKPAMQHFKINYLIKEAAKNYQYTILFTEPLIDGVRKSLEKLGYTIEKSNDSKTTKISW